MRDVLETRRGALVVGALITVVFLAIRVAVLVARDPYFDELFTLWLARRPFGAVLPSLLHDSGPPLYYWIARFRSIVALRILSLAFATGSLLLILTRRSLGPPRFLAGLLLAFYPPAVVYGVEARAYAMCGFLIAFAILELYDDRPFVAAALLALAAYTHFYAVLFFPVLLVRRWRGAAAAALAGVLFVPGFLMALAQPRAALAWNGWEPLFGPLTNLSFAGAYAWAIVLAPPMWLTWLAFAILVVAVSRSGRFAPAVLIPAILTIGFTLVGKIIYFPARFESIVAVPLMLWLVGSLTRWQKTVRFALAAALVVIGACVIAAAVGSYLERPLDPCRKAAIVVRRRFPPNVPVFASEYCYLEAATYAGINVHAFPAGQELHPGWVAPRSRNRTAEVAVDRAAAVAELPNGPFVWIGTIGSPQLTALRQVRRLTPYATVESEVLIARVEPVP